MVARGESQSYKMRWWLKSYVFLRMSDVVRVVSGGLYHLQMIYVIIGSLQDHVVRQIGCTMSLG